VDQPTAHVPTAGQPIFLVLGTESASKVITRDANAHCLVAKISALAPPTAAQALTIQRALKVSVPEVSMRAVRARAYVMANLGIATTMTAQELISQGVP